MIWEISTFENLLEDCYCTDKPRQTYNDLCLQSRKSGGKDIEKSVQCQFIKDTRRRNLFISVGKIWRKADEKL